MGFIWGVCFEDTEITVNYKMALYENIRKKNKQQKTKQRSLLLCPHLTITHVKRTAIS